MYYPGAGNSPQLSLVSDSKDHVFVAFNFETTKSIGLSAKGHCLLFPYIFIITVYYFVIAAPTNTFKYSREIIHIIIKNNCQFQSNSNFF